jgi:hypothetical protein
MVLIESAKLVGVGSAGLFVALFVTQPLAYFLVRD